MVPPLWVDGLTMLLTAALNPAELPAVPPPPLLPPPQAARTRAAAEPNAASPMLLVLLLVLTHIRLAARSWRQLGSRLADIRRARRQGLPARMPGRLTRPY